MKREDYEQFGYDFLASTIEYVTRINEGIPIFEEHSTEKNGGQITNEDRAEIGHQILSQGADSMGHPETDDIDELASDCICNILHAAHEAGADLRRVIDSGLMNFLAENDGY